MKSVFDLVQRYHALYWWSRETQEEVKREGKGGQGPERDVVQIDWFVHARGKLFKN